MKERRTIIINSPAVIMANKLITNTIINGQARARLIKSDLVYSAHAR